MHGYAYDCGLAGTAGAADRAAMAPGGGSDPGMLARQQLGVQPTAAHACEHGAGQWRVLPFPVASKMYYDRYFGRKKQEQIISNEVEEVRMKRWKY